jgi:hypothetical protein
MKTYTIDKLFRNVFTVIVLFGLLWLYIEKGNSMIIFCLFIMGVFIYVQWYNLVESITFIGNDTIEVKIRYVVKVISQTIQLKELNYSYKLEGGFRKSIMKLRIYHHDNSYEISSSTGWNESDIKEMLENLRNSSVKEIS